MHVLKVLHHKDLYMSTMKFHLEDMESKMISAAADEKTWISANVQIWMSTSDKLNVATVK